MEKQYRSDLMAGLRELLLRHFIAKHDACVWEAIAYLYAIIEDILIELERHSSEHNSEH